VRVTRPEPEPHLILALALTAATAPPAKACVDLTARLVHGPDAAAAGVQAAAVPVVTLLAPGDLLTDRGYSESVPGNFHHPLRQLGFRLVFDLHKHRRGITGTHRGATAAFGNLYSPGLKNYPDLVSTNAPSPFAPWEEWQRYFTDADLRGRFRLQTNGRPDAAGYTRLGCPGRSRRASIGCPIPATLHLVDAKGLLEVFTPPAAPVPDVCAQSWLTVPPDVTARSMDLEWGSRAWYDSFVRRRPRVEGANGILKNPTFAALAHMNIRVRGRAKVGLLAAFAAAITNLRAGDRWRTQVAGVRKLNEAITGASGRRAQRRRHTLDQLAAPAPTRRAGQPAGARAP